MRVSFSGITTLTVPANVNPALVNQAINSAKQYAQSVWNKPAQVIPSKDEDELSLRFQVPGPGSSAASNTLAIIAEDVFATQVSPREIEREIEESDD